MPEQLDIYRAWRSRKIRGVFYVERGKGFTKETYTFCFIVTQFSLAFALRACVRSCRSWVDQGWLDVLVGVN